MQKKIEQLKYLMQFFPLRLNFFVFLLFGFIIYHFSNTSAEETSSFHHFLVLMSKVGFWILIVMLIFSLLSTALAYIYFVRHRDLFNVQIINSSNNSATPKIEVQSRMKKVLRPILGSIGVRYLYNKNQHSSLFLLNSENKFNLFPTISHRSIIQLPNIKEYQIESALVSFQDLFRFFSFNFNNPLQSQFVNLPQSIDIPNAPIEPKTTDTDEIRTLQLRKIPGEWLEYKKYEAPDDIRRIVWKAFAKNKELIVRRQETLSPYASHIDCYASFYAAFNFPQDCLDAMSDFYKNNIWSFYKEISQSEFKVRLHLDQHKTGVSDSEGIAQEIAKSNWHNSRLPSNFIDTHKGSVLFLHSLMPTDEIEKVVNDCDKSCLVIYCNLGNIFDGIKTSKWWHRIFLKPKNSFSDEIVSHWKSSKSRLGFKKEIETHLDILKNSLAKIEIIS